MIDHSLTDARQRVLAALHSMRGTGTAELIRRATKLSPAALQDALLSLVADDWIAYDMQASVWRLTPARRRERAQMAD